MTGILADNSHGMHNQFAVNYNGAQVTIRVGKLSAQRLKIYDVRGRLCWETRVTRGVGLYNWKPQSAGVYIVSLEAGKDILIKRLNIVK